MLQWNAFMPDPQNDSHPVNFGVTRRYGANLPHWTKTGGIYFVTFRLADSVPVSVQRQWIAEREACLAAANSQDGRLSAEDQQRLFTEKVDRLLDSGTGACWMRQSAVAKIVAGALTHFDSQRYRMHAWCVMPNHVHAVVEPLAGHELPTILHSWKSYSAQQINRVIGQTGKLWQEEYYDHMIRDHDDLGHCVNYTIQNPGRAGLKDWPWFARLP